MSIMSAYEKSMKEGKLDKRIILQQPTPDNPDGKQFGGDGDYNAGIKNIVNEKDVNNEISLSKPKTNELKKLENRISLLEETLLLVMKQHTELMRK